MKLRFLMRFVSAFAVAASLLLAAPAVQAAEYLCTCKSTEAVGCPKNANLPARTPVSGASSLSDAQSKCQTRCVSILPGSPSNCYAGWEVETAADAEECGFGQVCLDNPINVESVPELVANILKAAIGIVGALALLVFIYGGFLWLTSRGDAGKVSAGKEAMKWAVVGLVVIFTSYGLVRFVFKAITG